LNFTFNILHLLTITMTKTKKVKRTDDIDDFLDNFSKENQTLNKPEPKVEEKKADLNQVTNPNLETIGLKSIDEIVKYADDMYKNLKEYVTKFPEFINITDKKKLEYFSDTLNHKEFMTEFPIVTRYMICMGQYSTKAFRRMLVKVSKVVHPDGPNRAKGYMEDQWIRRQADYVRYLWEEYQRKRNAHINTAEASLVWEDAYKTLKGEFDDFRNKYKDIEERTKEEKKQLAGDNVKDLLARLSTGEQKLSKEDEQVLLFNLQPLLWRKRYKVGPLKELTDLVNDNKLKFYEPTAHGIGTAEEVKEKPTITMIEHLADPKRMDEVPEHLRLNPGDLSKLPGYAPMPTIDE
jgi:hypothetical protein